MSSAIRFDVLRPVLVRRLLRRPWFPLACQLAALAALVLLLVNGWAVGRQSGPADLLTLRKTNLTTLVVWGLWWPWMILVVMLAGRVWCTTCPLELTSRVARWMGRRLGSAALPLPRVARAGWLVIASYVALQMLVAGLSIHRVPQATSLLLGTLLAGALLMGLLMKEERAFCKVACPAKALLSVYGRLTPVQLDVREPDRCAACTSLDCVRAENRDRFDRRSCPSLLRPFARHPDDDCVLCLQCAKVCPHDNVGVGVIASAARSRRLPLLRPADAVFVGLATGFVAHEIIGEAKTLEPLFHRVPAWMASAVPAVGFGWWEALWFLAIFPLALWAIVLVVSRLCAPGPLETLWLTAATAAAPVVAIAHAGKALAKLAAWAGFLPGALVDPEGLRTLDALTAGTIAAPTALSSLPPLGWTMLVGMLLIAWRSRNSLRAIVSEHPVPATVAPAVLVVFYAGVFASWIWR